MIRFVPIDGRALCQDEDAFSWWDTTSDSFFRFSGCQMWENWREFTEDFTGSPAELGRFRRLMPKELLDE